MFDILVILVKIASIGQKGKILDIIGFFPKQSYINDILVPLSKESFIFLSLKIFSIVILYIINDNRNKKLKVNNLMLFEYFQLTGFLR